MIGPGTATVEVEALSGNALPANLVVHSPGSPPGNGASPAAPTVIPVGRIYMQVGAFGDRANAEQLKQRLESNGVTNVVIRYDSVSVPALYRVRIGPISGSGEYDALASRVTSLRISDPQIVTETPPASDGG
jgi:cell division septation protein DedD